MRVLILANGDPPSSELLRRLAAAHDLVLATDGAAHRAAALGLVPDVVCGDFDSVRLDQARDAFPQAEFVRTPDQDRADLEKAVQLARDRGATAVTVTGAAGGRIDHTLGNFGLLLRVPPEPPLTIVDDFSAVRALSGTDAAPGTLRLDTVPGDIVSLLSFDGQARVTLRGVQWPLHNDPLPTGTLGVSNRATAEAVFLQARGGTVMVCHLTGPLAL